MRCRTHSNNIIWKYHLIQNIHHTLNTSNIGHRHPRYMIKVYRNIITKDTGTDPPLIKCIHWQYNTVYVPKLEVIKWQNKPISCIHWPIDPNQSTASLAPSCHSHADTHGCHLGSRSSETWWLLPPGTNHPMLQASQQSIPCASDNTGNLHDRKSVSHKVPTHGIPKSACPS